MRVLAGIGCFLISTVSTASAVEIQISGDQGTSYSIDCQNEVGMRMHFSGRAPAVHLLSTNRPPVSCTIKKDSTRGKVEAIFDLQIRTPVEVIWGGWQSVTLQSPRETKTLNFKYGVHPTPPDAKTVTDYNQIDPPEWGQNFANPASLSESYVSPPELRENFYESAGHDRILR